MSDKVKKAIENVKDKKIAPIVRHFNGYIVMALNESDYNNKCRKISNGDRDGFYTVERALNL